MQKVFNPFQANNIRVTDALEAQDDRTNAGLKRSFPQSIQIAIQIRCRPKEDLPFEVKDKDGRAGGIASHPFAHDAFLTDNQLRPFDFGSARHKKNDTQCYTCQNRVFNVNEDGSEYCNQNENYIKA